MSYRSRSFAGATASRMRRRAYRQMGHGSRRAGGSGCLAMVAVPLAALVTALALAAAASAGAVRITSCWDGDTCRAGAERIRLACIDTPERGQPGAAAATARTRQMVVGRTVGIRRITRDRYGRTVAELYGPEGNVGQRLVAEGHARIYRRFAYQCPWSR